jgi:hypothetical protein
VVDPYGDADLFAGEEADGGADAVDGRLILELLLEVKAERFLCSSTKAEDDVLGTALVEPVQQFRIIDGFAVKGREVDVVFSNGDAVGLQPGEIALSSSRCGHDPEAAAGLVKLRLLEQHAQVLEAGELGDAITLDEVPEQDHERAVGDGEVSAQQGLAIAKIVAQVLQCRSCGHHHQSAALANLVDRFLGVGNDEAYAKNALKTGRGADGLFSLIDEIFGVRRRRTGALLT